MKETCSSNLCSRVYGIGFNWRCLRLNNKKRESLKDARMYLERASNIVSRVLDEEENCLDNMPENLQSSEKYERMEAVIEKLEEAIEQIDSAKENIDEASE